MPEPVPAAPGEEPQSPLAAQAARLSGLVEGLSGALADSNSAIAALDNRTEVLDKASRRSRALVRALGVSVLFDVVVSALLMLGFFSNRSTVDEAQEATVLAGRAAAAADALAVANKDTLRAACLDTNDTRVGTIKLWEFILSATPAATPEARALIDGIRVVVHDNFAPRDCA